MILKSLHIERRASYEPDAGQLHGEIKYENHNGKISIMIDAETSQRILSLCAEGMVRESKRIANELTAAILEQAQPAIEDRT